MKLISWLSCFLALCSGIKAQTLPAKYYEFVKRADSLYKAKNYKGSAWMYSAAFKESGWRIQLPDLYSAACCWALANNPDSALSNLNRLVASGYFTDYERLNTDSDFKTLYQDPRWKVLLENVKAKKEQAEKNLNRPLMAQLDSIYKDDQRYRKRMDSVTKRFGWSSAEMKTLRKEMHVSDSLNLLKVTHILDVNGWLGPDVVGNQGNSTIFLVIQHSNQETQEKYLPMLREAVKSKKAKASSLALMEDRVAIGQGKMQLYGTQLYQDSTGAYVDPIEDVDQVDRRRAGLGLSTLSDYLKYWKINWSIEEYKKNLPTSPAYKHWLEWQEELQKRKK